MTNAIPMLVRESGSDTAASRAQRLAAQAATAGADAVHDLIAALSIARSEAEAVAELTSVPAGQRDVARRIGAAAKASIDTLQALIARA